MSCNRRPHRQATSHPRQRSISESTKILEMHRASAMVRTKEEEKKMSTLVAVVFDDQSTAFEMRAALAKMQKQYLLEMEDAVVVTRDENGKTKLHQAVSLTAAGAVSGSFWGMLIGLLFLNPLLGMAVGAGAGALSGRFRDIGLDDKMMKDIGDSLKPGTSAL